MDWSQCSAVDRHPDKLGGKWCFAGTRMSVASFFQLLNEGVTVDEFLEWFPDMERDQVNAVLAFVKKSLEEAVVEKSAAVA